MTLPMTYPRLLLAALASALLFAAAPAGAADPAFLAELEDVPLAPGLTENAGGMLFESPTGRIVEATAAATASVTAPQVQQFYMQTLPGLGWEPKPDGSFRRDNEVLRIDVDGSRRPVTVHFSVVPQ